MERRQRLRRVVILCASFGRNLAYYHAGQSDYAAPLLAKANPQASFWRQANGNFLDVCVLEFCKLFGDPKGRYAWQTIVKDAASFEVSLLGRLTVSADEFNAALNKMRRYRDKFVAHLDDDEVMNIPMLDLAHTSVSFYHEHVVTCEGTPGDFAGLTDTPEKFLVGYKECLNEAHGIITRAET